MLPALTLIVLVYSTGGTDVATSARGQLVAALKGSGHTVVDHAIDVAIADRRAGWRNRETLAFFGEIRALLERGRRARERVELEEATRAFADAEALCATHATAPGMSVLAAEAALDRGVVFAELRRVDEARAAFTRALLVAPQLQLTEKNARPDVVKLFRDVARQPRTPPLQPPVKDLVTDPVEQQLGALRAGPDAASFPLLVDSLGADAAIVAVVSADGKRMLAARVEPGCATAVVSLDPNRLENAAVELGTAPCKANPLELAVDDPRLAPPPLPVVAIAKHPAEKKAKKWPWIFAGAMGITAAVIGVTVGVVVSDPRYTVKIDGRSFGAP